MERALLAMYNLYLESVALNIRITPIHPFDPRELNSWNLNFFFIDFSLILNRALWSDLAKEILQFAQVVDQWRNNYILWLSSMQTNQCKLEAYVNSPRHFMLETRCISSSKVVNTFNLREAKYCLNFQISSIFRLKSDRYEWPWLSEDTPEVTEWCVRMFQTIVSGERGSSSYEQILRSKWGGGDNY